MATKAILTGDIVHSSKVETKKWLTTLEAALNNFGNVEKDWIIYRGDSFQLRTLPQQGLKAAITIKAGIKSIKELDVRLSIGIGEESHTSTMISKSNGSGYMLSGRAFDTLKDKRLIFQSEDSRFTKSWNLYLKISSHIMDQWQPQTAKTIYTALLNPHSTQKNIAKKLSISQSTISEHLKRGGYTEIKELIEYFEESLNQLYEPAD